MYKIVLLWSLLLSIILVISCIVNELTPPDRNSIYNCFSEYVNNASPNPKDIEFKIQGKWISDKTTKTFILNDTGDFYILQDKLILNAGKYHVNKRNDGFYLNTTPQSSEIEGNIYMCDDYIYNNTTESLWNRICQCFVK